MIAGPGGAARAGRREAVMCRWRLAFIVPLAAMAKGKITLLSSADLYTP